MGTVYINRGFINPPIPPAVTDGSSRWQQILFAIFPAGFTQLFTDFPFNGDLAVSRLLFALHQTMSLGEAAVCVAVSGLACDLAGLFPESRSWVPYAIIVVWAIAWLAKAITFV